MRRVMFSNLIVLLNVNFLRSEERFFSFILFISICFVLYFNLFKFFFETKYKVDFHVNVDTL